MTRFVPLGALLAAMLATATAPTAGAAAPTKQFRQLCPAVPVGFYRCFGIVQTKTAGTFSPFDQPSGYRPIDIQKAYNLPSFIMGGGQTVAIVDAFDAPNAEADLGAYRTAFGLPACTTANGCFRKVNQTGGTTYPPYDSGWEGEISLDVDMVSATCPKCHILLVEATTATIADLGAAVNEAVALHATVVSNSYGGPEYAGEATAAPFYNHPGVPMVASSGDSGFGVNVPAAYATVTAVGGTSLDYAFNARGFTETAWNGAGSGCSAYIAKPSWQHDTCANRTVADVSAVADPNTGVAYYDFNNFGWGVSGGTSVSSPIVASIYALAGRPSFTVSSSSPSLNFKAFFDVTSGNNGSCSPTYLCTAGVGYDGPTGWGTPSGTGGFVGAPTLTSVSPNTLPHPSTNQTVMATGTNFIGGDTLSFSGTGVTVSYTTYLGFSSLKAAVNISSGATPGVRDVIVTHPGGATSTCVGCFTVT